MMCIMNFLSCENSNCIHQRLDGCAVRHLQLDERGICRSYSPAAHALRLTENPMIYRTDGDCEQEAEDSPF